MRPLPEILRHGLHRLRRRVSRSHWWLRLDTLVRPRRWWSDVPPDFLIIGLQKSGTYWLTALLSAHPEIDAIPSLPAGGSGVTEGHFFDTLALRASDPDRFALLFQQKHGGFFRDLPPRVKGRPEELARQLFRRRYNAFLARHRRGRLVGEKTTEYVFHLELVAALYPGIKKICILRDPRDRTVSFHFHQLRKGRVGNPDVSDDEVAAYLARMDRELTCLVESPSGIHFLTFEALLADTAKETARLLEVLGAPAEDRLLADIAERASFRTLSGRRPGHEDPSSHYRKGVVGDWKEHLSPQQADRILETLEPRLRELSAVSGVELDGYLEPGGSSRRATGAGGSA